MPSELTGDVPNGKPGHHTKYISEERKILPTCLPARTNVCYPWNNLMSFPFIFAVCWQVRHNRPHMSYWPEFNWKELCKIHPCFAKRGSATEGEWGEAVSLKQVATINSIHLFTTQWLR